MADDCAVIVEKCFVSVFETRRFIAVTQLAIDDFLG